MVEITGGCDKCGRLTSVSIDVNNTGHIDVICGSCHQKYYSEEAIRDAKLKKLLKRSLIQRIKIWLKS